MSVNGFITLFSAVPLAFFVAIAVYVMYSFGLYRMAYNTGLKPAILAWFPGLRLYILGQMADRYNSTQRKRSIYRFLLPGLRLIGGVLALIMLACTVGVYLTGWGFVMGSVALFGILGGIVSLTARIMELLCYYKTFCDYEPEYSVPYLILCILGLEWIPMFLCRNNVPVGIAGYCHPRQPRYNVD